MINFNQIESMTTETTEQMYSQVTDYLVSVPDPHNLQDLPLDGNKWDVPLQNLVIKHIPKLPTFIAA